NTIKNIIFYRAWEDEKRLLEEKIKIRTEELNKQKESFEAIYNGSKDAIAILDIKSNFLQVNRAYTDMTGFTKEELLKTSCLALTAKKDLEASKKAMSEVLKVGFIKNFEKSCIIKDGFIVITNMSMSLLKNPDRILISIRDITKLKQTQKALEMQKIKAEDATKAKSEFLANMSHEIRTPMNGIIGMAHLALSSNLDEKQKEYIQNINNSAKSLLGIINDILDYSKAEAGKIILEKVDFDLVALIESVINMLKIKADEKNLNILIKYEKDLGRYFYGDSLRLKQIITNLLSNAIKFTDKGNIELSVKMILKDRFIFEVTDTGIGLTKDEQSKLFKSFSQADGSVTRKYGGTGLGLSISKQLVELMDGRIWLESELGVGSKFIFEITLELKDDIIKDKEVYSQNHIKNINQKTLNIYKKTISKQMLEKLFLDLENALKTKRPKKCEIAIKELDIYLLEEKDTKIFNKIKKHVSSYRFKDAIKLLQERI
ncbi:MAG: PAS domain S-box protein, partial [Epsilonproteobacteria bacterium]|nr:PAS domain S-box protein [Campylobacterota bacterium]